MQAPIRVTLWNERRQDRTQANVVSVYPKGMNAAIADGLAEIGGFDVTCAELDDPEQGCSEETLAKTDVLFWWAHCAHGDVMEETVQRVHHHVMEGMGLVVLHSGHFSKVFKRVLGTTGSLKWREDGQGERLWTVTPSHPIAMGIPEHFELEHEEMYGEPFDIPSPETIVFIGWFPAGEVFRAGCTWQRGNGRVFYFQPGHETHPIYFHPVVRRILANAARWCAPRIRKPMECPHFPALPAIQ